MNKPITCLSCACALALGVAVFPVHAFVLPNGEVIEEMTGDARWGCEVLLCLANPNGPKAESECVPPIDRLYRHLRKGHGMPSCPMAGAGSYARPVHQPYEDCGLLGMEDAPKGWLAEGKLNTQGRSRSITLSKSPSYNWAGESYSDSDDSWTTGSKACVQSPQAGTYSFSYDCDSAVCSYATARVYPVVRWLKQKNPSAIDVFIEGKLFSRVWY